MSAEANTLVGKSRQKGDLDGNQEKSGSEKSSEEKSGSEKSSEEKSSEEKRLRIKLAKAPSLSLSLFLIQFSFNQFPGSVFFVSALKKPFFSSGYQPRPRISLPSKSFFFPA
ncbi:MAG: hypothetical protein O3A78_11045 [Nitrospinae bacterium]|nr:hypothetical protein [Nitrospinota bacterium]MDA1110324.1 hypothetical protein [Nitrospinota bacterium]